MLPLTLLFLACSSEPAPAPAPEPAPAPAPAADPVMDQAKALFAPLPAAPEIAAERLALGHKLYFETQLSLANDISCNSCHGLDTYGVDRMATSTGHEGQKGGRNAPTVYNSSLNLAQFWDGRAEDLAAQAKGPPLNPIEMAMPDAATIEKRLSEDANYPAMFKAAFPDQESPVTFDNMATAIADFETQLLTPGPFDAYLGGDASALTAEQTAGLKLFMDSGCTACHKGPALGSDSYQKLGAARPFEDADEGRKAVTGNDADLQFFKVPTLRNIAETGPYFHTGKVETLSEAITLMGAHQLGKDFTPEEVASLESFLGALTGPVPEKWAKAPQ